MIEVKNVSYVYSAGTPFEVKALDDVSFTIGEGEFIGLIGHTGSGKSTLVNIISGIVKPTSGQVLIDNIDITNQKSVTRALKGKIGLVFQYPEYQLFEETVYKDIAFGPKNIGVPDSEIDDRVKEALKTVGLSEDILNKSPFELSGGQKRRVAIAGILSMKPKILILDEPTAGLDPGGRDEILGRIKELHSDYSITVILVSHSMEDVAKICEKVIVMSQGKILKYSYLDEVFKDSEELRENGLSVPEITTIMQKLKSLGLDVRDDIFRIEDAKEEILKILKGGEDQ
ncbi:MAG: energy-coupling factor transporter ATPase [Bacillota bacterium]|nr:energy-coupling factor transporter ATPase [Bacillota bacterium]